MDRRTKTRTRSRRHSEREQRLLDAALTWAHDHGLPADHPLPRGRRDSADTCPLARATGYLVAAPFAAPPGDGVLKWVSLPPQVAQFLELFDKGRYPELVQR